MSLRRTELIVPIATELNSEYYAENYRGTVTHDELL